MSFGARRIAALAAFFVIATACGRPPVQVPDAGEEPVQEEPAVTSLSPEPGPFNDKVTVTLTTDKPATIYLTTDGSDPKVDSAERQSAEGTLTVELTGTTTLTFFSRTAGGAEEPVRAAQYIRAGGKPGTISGVVVVDTLAVDHAVGLFHNGSLTDLGAVTQPQEVPFVIEGAATGTHRLRAMADLNDDGTFVPVLDLASDTTTVTLDLADPFKASAEDVRIYLGASAPELCTLQGTITLPDPAAGETLRISALSPSAFGSGADPQALLSQFQNGYLMLVDPAKTEYAYALTDLEPGSYIPVPVLFSAGQGALGMNFLANPLSQVSCTAGQTVTKDFAFGPVDLSGAVTLQPQTAPTQSLVYGIVAGRSASLNDGLQSVLMPVVFAPGQNSGEFVGGYAGRALKSNRSFGLRVFTNLDSQNALMDALIWSVSVFGSAAPHTTLQTQTVDATKDITLPLP